MINIDLTSVVDSAAVHRELPVVEIAADSVGSPDMPDGLSGFDAFWDSSAREGDAAASAAADIFGRQSYLYTADAGSDAAQTALLSANPVYTICVIAFVFVYLYGFLRHTQEISTLFKLIFDKKQITHNEEYAYTFSRFINTMRLAAILLLSIGIVKGMEAADPAIAGNMPEAVAFLAVPLIACVLTLVGGVQYVFMRVAGYLTLSDDFVRELMMLKKALLALMGLIAAPAVIAGSFMPDSFSMFALGVAFLIVNSVIFIYLIKSLALFFSHKVSFLLWILYLCAVEAMPLAMIFIALIRLL